MSSSLETTDEIVATPALLISTSTSCAASTAFFDEIKVGNIKFYWYYTFITEFWNICNVPCRSIDFYYGLFE